MTMKNWTLLFLLTLIASLPSQGAESSIQKIYASSNLTNSYASWGINPTFKKSNIQLAEAWKLFSKKKDITVAVVDTGIDPLHPFLKNNLTNIQGKLDNNNYGIDYSKGRLRPTQPFDSHGHGTHVAGIIKSVFPEVKIVTLKYYNPNASGQDNLNSTIKALKAAVDAKVDIINYSGGGPEPALEELRILKEAEKKGILVVAAAGNERSNIDDRTNAYYPASYGLNNIITVTAHDQELKILSSSNWGQRSVDLSAPGYRVKSSIPNSRAGRMTGTSQATAFVSGAAALLMSNFPTLNSLEIKEILKTSVDKVVGFKLKSNTEGKLNVSKAYSLASKVASEKQVRKLANKERKLKSQKIKKKRKFEIIE